MDAEERMIKNILNGLSPDTKIYRVVNVDRFFELIEERKLILVKPHKWDDPFENLLSKTIAINSKGERIGFSITNDFFGQCWTLRKECDGIWRNYASLNNGVRLETTVRKLLSVLFNYESKKTQTQNLAEVFSGHLAWNAARLEFLSQFILALISVRSVNLMEIATAFCSRAKQDSVYRRIQRFFGDSSVCQKTIAQLVVSILSQVCEAPFTLSMDRTNWKLGKTDINILAVGIVHKGYAFPIAWILLPKRGNSNTQERKQVMEKVLKVLSSDQIEMLLADREFIGKEWFKWLIQEKIHFNIRIRDNLKIDSKGKKKHVKLLFRNVKDKEPKHLKKAIHILGFK